MASYQLAYAEPSQHLAFPPVNSLTGVAEILRNRFPLALWQVKDNVFINYYKPPADVDGEVPVVGWLPDDEEYIRLVLRVLP